MPGLLDQVMKRPLTGFIAWFFRVEGTTRRVGVARHGMMSVAAKRRPPPGTITAFLFSAAAFFPTVSAWSPWSKTKDEPAEDETDQRQQGNFKGGLRLLKNDQQLMKDIGRADELYSSGYKSNYDEAYVILMKHMNKLEPEVLWRLGRLTYEKSKLVKEKGEKEKLVEEAYNLVFRSMALDEMNFAVHKWMAILINELSSYRGTKEQILQSVKVKEHMMRAAELNPRDATSIYLLGHWCFTIADIPWYQRKLAETLFATPPKCSFEEAYTQFLKAERTQPGFYSMNLLMLAKSSIKLGEMEKAEEYLVELKKTKVKTEDDFLAKKEGRQLREKYFEGKDFSNIDEENAAGMDDED